MLRHTLSAVSLIACIALPAKGHEFWLEPLSYQVAAGEPVAADLRLGQDFEGSRHTYLPRAFTRFDFAQGGGFQPVPGTVGDRPALNLDVAGEGLVVAVHATTDRFLTWDTWQDFVGFVTHKDAAWVLDEHDAKGYPREAVREVYSRYVKTLVAVGHGEGQDVEAGLLTEIVALENPYTGDMSDGIDVRVLFDGTPRAETQIEVFEKAPDGAVRVFTVRTNADGEATVPVAPGLAYMLDAVVLREPVEARDGDNPVRWESLWANLTFAIPAR